MARSEPKEPRLDLGAPEFCGEARWRGWGGCWSCRKTKPTGGPLVACGCAAPSPPLKVELETWESTWERWMQTVRNQGPRS